MLFPPAGEELPPELLVEVMFVVNNPDYTVMDDVCHKRPFFVSLYMYGKIGNVTTENFFFEKNFQACNILLFSIHIGKKDEQKNYDRCYSESRKRSNRFHNADLEYRASYETAGSCSMLSVVVR